LHMYNDAVDLQAPGDSDGGQDRQFDDFGQLSRARRPARCWLRNVPWSSTTSTVSDNVRPRPAPAGSS
jgi:hypothetical protein